MSLESKNWSIRESLWGFRVQKRKESDPKCFFSCSLSENINIIQWYNWEPTFWLSHNMHPYTAYSLSSYKPSTIKALQCKIVLLRHILSMNYKETNKDCQYGQQDTRQEYGCTLVDVFDTNEDQTSQENDQKGPIDSHIVQHCCWNSAIWWLDVAEKWNVWCDVRLENRRVKEPLIIFVNSLALEPSVEWCLRGEKLCRVTWMFFWNRFY